MNIAEAPIREDGAAPLVFGDHHSGVAACVDSTCLHHRGWLAWVDHADGNEHRTFHACSSGWLFSSSFPPNRNSEPLAGSAVSV